MQRSNNTGRVDPHASAYMLLTSLAVSLIVFAGYVFIWNLWIKPYYYPRGDSFSVLVNSLPVFDPDVSAWFLEGFKQYFHVYPDMSRNATNFIRPGVNATLYLEWFLFHTHWERYLLTTYAIVAMISGLVHYTATRVLSVSRRLALLAAFSVAAAPSVDTNALWDPTFAFDLLAGALVLAGLLALVRDRVPSAWCLFSFAAFTKETALFAPALAALVILLDGRTGLWRRVLWTVAFLLPLAVWGALRWHVFHGDEGVYIVMDVRHGALHEAVVRAILGAMNWPIAAQVYRKETLPLLRAVRVVGTTLNVIFWLGLLAVIGLKIGRGASHRAVWLDRLNQCGATSLALPLFCVGSLALPMLLDVPRRFGGVFFPLFVLCMVAAEQKAYWRLARAGAIVMTASVGIAGALLLVADLRYLQPGMVHSWRISRAYISALHASSEPLVFSVDDTSGAWSSDQYVQRFAGYQGRLIRVNDLAWDATCPGLTKISVHPEINGSITVTSFATAQCGGHYFTALYPPLDPAIREFTRRLPEAQIQYDLGRPGTISQGEVSSLVIHITPGRADSALLIPQVDMDREDRISVPAPSHEN